MEFVLISLVSTRRAAGVQRRFDMEAPRIMATVDRGAPPYCADDYA
jgi:hypothetical protein